MTYVPLQQKYSDDPWRVLVVSILLNLTSRKQVGPILEQLFELWPTPEAMAFADTRLEDTIRPLGLWRGRSVILRGMSLEVAQGGVRGREGVLRLPGCGTYAADAYEVFCNGDLDIEPTDHVLADWICVERAREG